MVGLYPTLKEELYMIKLAVVFPLETDSTYIILVIRHVVVMVKLLQCVNCQIPKPVANKDGPLGVLL